MSVILYYRIKERLDKIESHRCAYMSLVKLLVAASRTLAIRYGHRNKKIEYLSGIVDKRCALATIFVHVRVVYVAAANSSKRKHRRLC